MKLRFALLLIFLSLPLWGAPLSPREVLRHASSLDDQLVGEAASVSPNYEAYARASRDASARTEGLWLRQHASPAGRIYGALLLWHGGMSATEALGQLTSDRAKLKFKSGCEVIDTTVAEVARAFLKEGNYLGFKGLVEPLSWRNWKQGKLARVLVENQLYRRGDDFYVHIAILNTGDTPIGLAEKGRLLYINQWGGHARERRSNVDERRLPYQTLSAAQSTVLRQDFKSGRLTVLAPGQQTSYFTRFNGTAGVSAVDRLTEKFLVVALDGRVELTDGTRCEILGRLDDDFAETDVAFPLPITWNALPANARVSSER